MRQNTTIVGMLLMAWSLTIPSSVIASPTSVKTNSSVTQQTTTIEGTVSDQTGILIGATIMVKGTQNGTITDYNGKFTLKNVRKGSIIKIGYIGYLEQEIEYTGQSVLNVVLKEDAQSLDEVVVTALGMKRSKKALGYAATEVKGDVLARTGTISPVAALQGKVAGVQIEQSDGGMFGNTKIQIRGASTLSGNNQPIFVIDGIILDNGISDASADWNGNPDDWGNELKSLNPDDFERITVLKGAAATAMYGSRGLNGAVVITTKSGQLNSGVGVRVNQTFGVDYVFDTPDMQNSWGPGMMPGYNDFGDGTSKWDTQKLMKNSSGVPSLITSFTNVGLGWGKRFDGSEVEGWDHKTTNFVGYPDNYKDMFQLGLNSNTNVSISGGNDKTTFYTSISYRDARGTIENNHFTRTSFMAKASHMITDKMKIDASINFVNSKPKNPQKNYGELFTSAAVPREFDVDYYRNKYKGPHGGIAQGDDEYASVLMKGTWWGINENSSERKETSVRPTLNFTYNIFDWLSWRTEMNYNYYYTRYENKQLGSGYAMEGGYYGLGTSTKEQVNFNTNININKKINEDWEVHGLLRGEYFDQENQYTDAWTDGGLIVPGKYFLDNSKKTAKRSAGINSTKRIVSFAFTAGASYKDQLFVDVTGRNDWSSSLIYADGTGNYSYFYPSVSGSWLLHETFDLPEFINFSKVRASWAQVGNDTNPYYVNSGYKLTNTEFGDANIYSLALPSSVKSRDLKPERKTSIEFGLDWRFLDNRIGLDFTWYKENTRDQIINISVPAISGISGQTVNAGNIENSGVEIALKTVPIRTKDWEMTADFTYTKNKNKIVSLHENVADFINLSGATGYGNYRIASVAKVGAAYGLLMSDSKPLINENGDPVLRWTNNGRTAFAKRSGKLEEVGSLVPDFLGSMATSLTYKNWSLRASFDMRFGGMVAAYSNRYGTAYGVTGVTNNYRQGKGLSWTSQYADRAGMEFSDGIIPEGVFADGTNVTFVDGTSHDVSGQSYAELVKAGSLEPSHLESWAYFSNSWGQGTLNSDWFEELNYISLREISLSYRVPTTFAKKMGMQTLNLGLSGRNLGYLYNSLSNNLNPESVRGTSSTEFRIRGFNPYTANFLFNINASF